MATSSSSEDHAQLPILIVGSGCCGLAIAQGLKNNGIPYKIFEKQPAIQLPKARDWALACHWSSSTLSSLMGPEKWARVSEALVDPNIPVPALDLCPVLNGATGELIKKMPFPNFYRFLRSRLRSLLAEGLDVACEKQLVSIEYNRTSDSRGQSSVVAHFADNTSVRGCLLIGADGSQSRVRNLLLGPEKAALKRLPFSATFINSSFTAEQARHLRSEYHPVFNAIMHPGNMVGMLALLDGADVEHPEKWRFTFYTSARLTPEELEEDEAQEKIEMKVAGGEASEQAKSSSRKQLQRMRERAQQYTEPMRSVHKWTADDCETIYQSRVANWDPSLPDHEWDNRSGLVTLTGDAAHPMTYHRGQGLNHAIDDAGRLVTLLAAASAAQQCQSQPASGNAKDSNSSDLIAEYEKEMRARTGEEVRLSETNTFMMHDWETLRESPFMKASISKVGLESG